MLRTFFIVGPTATGKSELAADLAGEVGAEILSADAFQIYRGLNQLTAKPDATTLAKVRHHLIGTIPLTEVMNAEKFRHAAICAMEEINARGKLAIVVGGSGLYIRALTHGLAPLPKSDPLLREKLNAMSLDDLRSKLAELDPDAVQKIDTKNRRRLVRALEICLLTGSPLSAHRKEWASEADNLVWQSSTRTDLPTSQTRLSASPARGVFVSRDREQLYERINQRVENMFHAGVIEEVRAAGLTSETASQMIGLREIREFLAGEKSCSQCVADIQQATRRYAKRQLTWFRRQTNFAPLNLSLLTHNEAVKWISLRIASEGGTRDD